MKGFALGIAALGATLAFFATQIATAQLPAAPPLTDEHMSAASGLSGQAGTIDIQGDCTPASGKPRISYTATGPAVGPYQGTYREVGTATLDRITPTNLGVPIVAFEAQFTIDSPLGQVRGTKQLDPAVLNHGICNLDTTLGFGVGIHQFVVGATYTAVIETSEVTCTTQGSARRIDVAEQDAPGHPNVDFHRFDEFFTSGTAPACSAHPGAPTSKEQCKNDGWRQFSNPSFKNQGECIAYVNHHDGRGMDG